MRARLTRGRDAALYALALLATALLALVPAAAADRLAAAAGRLVYRRGGPRPAQLRANLRQAMGPAAAAAEVDSAAAQVYANYGRYMCEFFTMHWPDLWGRRRRMVVDEGPLRDARRRGRGVVMFGIHGGNWDLAASECARRFGSFHSAGESVRPAWLGRLTNRVRRGAGTQLYDPMRAARPLLRALRNGEFIGLVADRAVAGPGAAVQLCGRPAVLPAGPVWLAMRGGAPLLPTVIERDATGAVHIEFLDPIALDDLRADAAGIAVGAQRMADALTRMIQQGYAGWFALQPIWTDLETDADAGGGPSP